MDNPIIGLTALVLVTPYLPVGTSTVSIDASVLPIIVNADLNTIQVEVSVPSGTQILINPTVVGGINQFSGLVPILQTDTTVQIYGRNYDPANSSDPNANDPLLTATVQFNLIPVVSQNAVTIGPPSGITIYRGITSCTVEWAIPNYAGFQGVRLSYSTDPTGVTIPFTQLGDLYTATTRTATLPLTAATTTTATIASSVAGNSTVIETVSTPMITTNFSSVAIPQTLINSDLFYVQLTNVIQDTNTNTVYESQAAGPIKCGFVALQTTNPYDALALQKSADIATRLVTSVNTKQPNLDLSSLTEIRDVIINPVALEGARTSVREYFSRMCQSVSALQQFDDANNDGVSDPVTTSVLKQQLQQAYQLSNTDIQTFIDGRFDVLGERCGTPRLGATTSTVQVTWYTYQQPTSTIVIPIGAVVTTTPDDSSITTVSFTTTSSAIIQGSNASAYYDAVNGWWGIAVSAQCNTAGSIGNVGAGAINQVTSGGPSGLSVTNLVASTPAVDNESNADYAARMINNQIVGRDTSSKGGYYRAARAVPGVVSAIVIPSGNVDMLRDWDEVRQKHVYGKVDVYVKGVTTSEQTSLVPFTYPSTSNYGVLSSYITLTLLDSVHTRFTINGFSSLQYPLYTLVELAASSQGTTLYLGTAHAQVDNTTGILTLDPTENVYQRNADGTTSIWQIGGANATNSSFLQATNANNVVFNMMARFQAGIQYVPTLQPLIDIGSITGPITGTIPPLNAELIRVNDFLLTGGSNEAGDQVVVPATNTVVTTKTIAVASSPVVIDTGMAVPLSGSGIPGNILSLRSADLSTLYTFGVDYNIVATGRYHSYALNILADSATGLARIPAGTSVVVAYNKYALLEELTPVTDTIALSGTSATALSTPGFIQNIWLPESYGNTSISQNTNLINTGVPWADRYILVTYTTGGTVTYMFMGQDFTLSINPSSYVASLTRIAGGRIPDGAQLSVSYFTNEVFTVTTDYPAYVQQVALAVQDSCACADVLVKAMVSNGVDLTFGVSLDSVTSAATADPLIRTALSNLLYDEEAKLSMSQVVSAVNAVQGVVAISLPLNKCAKSDGSYSIGEIIPTGTVWGKLASDTAFKNIVVPSSAWITTSPVLVNSTLPSGGQQNAYVGLLYEGQSYTRTLSIQAFLDSTAPAFYMVGEDDYINPATPLDSTYPGRILLMVPPTVVNPALYAYRATYQVYNEEGATDITVASTEYLVPGTFTIIYEGS
jgi:hypothetical protein